MKPRNVFISFLGNSPYSGSRYIGDKPPVDRSTRFVQVATLASVADQFGKDDQVYIFTTVESLKNWADQKMKGDPGSVDEKLKSEILELNIGCNIENVMVPDGKSQDELWDIFTIMFEKLKTRDNLYFDITHGFRSLPLLALPLINYAKLLKSVTVSGIFYGAYDRNKWKSSIWNLTDFSKLQDWTNNANIFLRTGNAKRLAEQIEGESFQAVKQGLERFSEFTLVNRGMDIYGGSEIVQLSKDLEAVEAATDPAEKAVVPILKKVKDQFVAYQENSAINGFHAVKWCIENGLIQQAATLLEEFIVTYLMDLIGITKKTSSVTRAVILSFAKQGLEEYTYGTRANYPIEKEQKLGEALSEIEELARIGVIAKDISNKVRNDVNHAGFRKSPKPKSYAEIRSLTIEQFNNLCDVLAIRGHHVNKITE